MTHDVFSLRSPVSGPWRRPLCPNRERTACMMSEVAEDDLVGGKARRAIAQRIYRKRRHKSECPIAAIVFIRMH